MKFTLAVHHPDDEHALRFARAALEAGHEIPLVFFYHDGVYAADGDRPSTQQSAWQSLVDQHRIPLAVCIGAASRRELVEESAPDGGRICQGFDVVGLGQYIGALIESDRLVTFAG
jgi:tRNA 2-thiouridine synthesizing protein D